MPGPPEMSGCLGRASVKGRPVVSDFNFYILANCEKLLMLVNNKCWFAKLFIYSGLMTV